MMQLQEFVSETLQQIINGVKDAQSAINDEYATIAPFVHHNLPKESKAPLVEGFDLSVPATMVSFDVAVTAVAKSESGKGGGIKVAGAIIGVHGESKRASEEESHSRIQFEVPVYLPQALVNRIKEHRQSGGGDYLRHENIYER